MKCYAAWNPDSRELKGSASGGVATLLAKAVLSRGGVVFGTRWNTDMQAVVAWTEDDPTPFKGSKYVFSQFSAETRGQLKTFLEAGRTVLFIGTPCQVAGLAKLRESYPERLICADLVCHGTVEPSYLAAEIAHLSRGRHITELHFREGPVFRMSLWSGEKCISSAPAARSPYLHAYLAGITLREACYSCPFAKPERNGDITLGDFIGIDRKGVSFAWPHSPAGEALLKECGAQLEERDTDERFVYRPGLLEPTSRHPLRERFLKEIALRPFPQAIRRTLRGYFLRRPFRQAWKWLHHQAHLLKLKICRG